jgi:hypothetical protein
VVQNPQASFINVMNTVTESMSAGSSKKGGNNSESSSICGDPTVASNHNEHSGVKRGRENAEEQINLGEASTVQRRRLDVELDGAQID